MFFQRRRRSAVREIVIYMVAAVGSLFILGYSIHMFVGGLVSAQTEMALIIAACTVGVIVIAAMAWDVVRRRRGRSKLP